MAIPQEAAGAVPQEQAPGGAPQGAPGGEQGAQAIQAIGQSLMSLREGAAEAAPPEAVKALDQAIAGFSQFLEIMGGGQGPDQSQSQPATADTQGTQARPVSGV